MKNYKFPLIILAFATVGVVAPGCSKQTAEKENVSATEAPASKGHAAANVKPGSHEDWCLEHAVPESQCSRCQPELVAAFKATGDWCEEHGLPESQCTKCNPNLKITRPPKEK
jgi:hypothetical protein